MNVFQIKTPLAWVKTAGIGLTNKCDLNCWHCYSRNLTIKDLSIKQLKEILTQLPNVKSINYWTWESYLNPDFESIVKYVDSMGIKQALTTNSNTLKNIQDDLLVVFEDVDISIDFPNAKLHDWRRNQKGIFNNALNWLERCKWLGINTSIVSVLMKNNHKYLKDFKNILDIYDVNLRINLYKAVNTNSFTPTYKEFWNTIKDFSENFDVLSCSEPILSIVCDDVKGGSMCGNSIRIHPDGEISSCVYVKDWSDIRDFNMNKNTLPELCKSCWYKENCKWWCYWRRITNWKSNMPDMYCPFQNNEEVPNFKINIDKNKAKNLIHSDYLCTLILR